MSTLNKNSNRDSKIDFKQQQFNLKFVNQDIVDEEELKPILMENIPDDTTNYILPHQRSMGEIILGVREVFFTSLEMLIDKKSITIYL